MAEETLKTLDVEEDREDYHVFLDKYNSWLSSFEPKEEVDRISIRKPEEDPDAFCLVIDEVETYFYLSQNPDNEFETDEFHDEKSFHKFCLGPLARANLPRYIAQIPVSIQESLDSKKES